MFKITFPNKKMTNSLLTFYLFLHSPPYSSRINDSPFSLASSLLSNSQHNCASIFNAGFDLICNTYSEVIPLTAAVSYLAKISHI